MINYKRIFINWNMLLCSILFLLSSMVFSAKDDCTSVKGNNEKLICGNEKLSNDKEKKIAQDEFTDNKDGTVTNTKTGLVWKKCTEGQTGRDCNDGRPHEFSMTEAQEYAAKFNDKGGLSKYKDWRLPTIDELQSLVFCSDEKYNVIDYNKPYFRNRVEFICSSNTYNSNKTVLPTIKQNYFPNTQNSYYWSSTNEIFYANENTDGLKMINFDDSAMTIGAFQLSYIRLVRKDLPPVYVSKKHSYSKISNKGNILPNTAKIGNRPMDWACIKDNDTGLTWEIKTNDNGLHDIGNEYTNYTFDYPKCDDNLYGGSGGCSRNHITGNFGNSTNTDGFAALVNQKKLCGKNDWRLPTLEELSSLIYCPTGKKEIENNRMMCSLEPNQGTNLTIDRTYFPTTTDKPGIGFWSSTSLANNSDSAWEVNFGLGSNYKHDKSKGARVILVSGKQ